MEAMLTRREICQECGQHTHKKLPVVRMNVNVDADVYERFQKALDARGESVSNAIRRLINGYIENNPPIHHDGRHLKEAAHG